MRLQIASVPLYIPGTAADIKNRPHSLAYYIMIKEGQENLVELYFQIQTEISTFLEKVGLAHNTFTVGKITHINIICNHRAM